jgi:hypothetical protein
MESYQNQNGTERAIEERDDSNKNAQEPQEVTNEYVLNVAFSKLYLPLSLEANLCWKMRKQ